MHDTVIAQRHDWSSRERLDALWQRIATCLHGVPGFRTLSLFGSLAEKRADGYSDIDLMVTTDDLPAAQQRLLETLETLGPIESCWVMALRPDEWNPTILFADEGYYHKLDLGLVSANAANRTIPPEQTILLATRQDDLPHVAPCRSRAYVPAEDSVGHFLLGQYLGGTRYLKARKRGRALSCYRFVSAAADWRLRALYVRVTGGTPRWHAKLSTEEYAALDRLDVDGWSEEILGALDYSTPTSMDQALCHILQHMSDLCREIAAALGEDLPEAIFQRMLSWMRDELEQSEGCHG